MMSTRKSQLSSKASAGRGFVLRTLGEAGRPITRGFRLVFARDNGLGEDDARRRLNPWPSFLTNMATHPIVPSDSWR
jgi:hypothetical protein